MAGVDGSAGVEAADAADSNPCLDREGRLLKAALPYTFFHFGTMLLFYLPLRSERPRSHDWKNVNDCGIEKQVISVL